MIANVYVLETQCAIYQLSKIRIELFIIIEFSFDIIVTVLLIQVTVYVSTIVTQINSPCFCVHCLLIYYFST